MKMSKFKIEIDDLIMLALSCIELENKFRVKVWFDIIDVHYKEMNAKERVAIYSFMLPELDVSNHFHKLFIDRFNPENQYKITVEFEGETKCYEAFMRNDKYYISSSFAYDYDFIKMVEDIN